MDAAGSLNTCDTSEMRPRTYRYWYGSRQYAVRTTATYCLLSATAMAGGGDCISDRNDDMRLCDRVNGFTDRTGTAAISPQMNTPTTNQHVKISQSRRTKCQHTKEPFQEDCLPAEHARAPEHRVYGEVLSCVQ